MLSFSSYTKYLTLTFQGPFSIKRNESLLLLFDGLWKVKAKYILFWLNALAMFLNVKRASRHPALIGNYLTCSQMSWVYQPSEWFVISSFKVVCGAWDLVATREIPCEKNVDLKSFPVNVLKSVTKVRKRGGGMWTE